MIFKQIKHWFFNKPGEEDAKQKAYKPDPSTIKDDAVLSNPQIGQWTASAEAAFSQKNYQAAGDYYLKIIQSDDSNSIAMYRYAKVLYEQGRFEEAADYFNKVLGVHHDSYNSYYRLGKIEKKLGRYSSALDHYIMAIHYNPDFIPAYIGAGDIKMLSGNNAEAVSWYKRALEKCNEPQVRARILNAIATIHHHNQKFDEAVSCLKDAIKHVENNATYLQNLGINLNEMGLFIEAETYIRKADLLDPDNAEILLNLSWILLSQSKYDEAEEYCNKALALDPENENINNHVARLLKYKGEDAAALSLYQSVIQRHPDYDSLRRNMAFHELQLGKLDTGWKNYEIRKVIKKYKGVPGIPFPETAADFSGKNVLILPEQGIGDELRYASCIPDLVNTAAQVTVGCDKRLVNMYERSFPEATILAIEREEKPSNINITADMQELIGSLPLHFRPTLESFPREKYLMADQKKVSYWRKRLDRLGPGPKIGISWRSSRRDYSHAKYYASLNAWEKIITQENACFINLQYDDCSDELADIHKELGIDIINFEELDQYNDIEGVAALMSSLDLVITGGTAVSVLAGALGVNVWVLYTGSVWILLGQDYDPWSSSTRIFQQQQFGGWPDLIERVHKALGEYVEDWHMNKSVPGSAPGRR